MRTPAALVLGLLLAAGPLPGRGGRVGEGLPRWLSATGPLPLPAHTARPPSGVMAATHLPDTSRRPPADTLRQRPALVPDPPSSVTDDDKPTRKTALFAALALAVLTVSTLLLYNVRSR